MIRLLIFAALSALITTTALAQRTAISAVCVPTSNLKANGRCDFDPEAPGPPYEVVVRDSFSFAPLELSVAADGSRMAYTGWSNGLQQSVFEIATLAGTRVSLEGVSVGFRDPYISPGGTRIAYAETNDGGLFVRNIETDEVIRVADDAWGEVIEWSPDGLRLAYVAWDQQTVKVINADGEGDATQIFVTNAWVSDRVDALDWSPQGDEIVLIEVVTSPTPGVVTVYKVKKVSDAGGAAATLFESDVQGVQLMGVEWSPDGDSLAIFRIEFIPATSRRRKSIELLPASGGSLTRLFGSTPDDAGTVYLDYGTMEWWTRSRGLVVNDVGDGSDADTGDDLCDADLSASGEQCTLRAAIQIANRQTGRDEITFDLLGGTTIAIGSALPTITDPVVIDGASQPGYADTPLVSVQGSGNAGFSLAAGDSEIIGLAIGGFSNGIAISGAGGNVVTANYIGTDASGATAVPNAIGVVIDGSPDNTIGGEEAGLGNVISGNAGAGVSVSGTGTSGVVIAGNRIGTTSDGTFAVPNEAEGVLVNGAPGVRVGGSTSEARNIISGNATHGILVTGAEATGLQVQGNFIGLAANGTDALPNGTDPEPRTGHHGISVVSASGVVIGGVAIGGADVGNVISANTSHGVFVTGTPDEPADDVQVLGNRIGTNADGTVALANGADAIYFAGAARGAIIGQAGAGNVIVSGAEGQDNATGGVWLIDLGETGGAPDNAVVEDNTIGMNATGSALLGDMITGIVVATEQDGGGVGGVRIGDEGAGNRIAGHAIGLSVFGPRSSGALVAFNTVGLFADGSLAREERDAIGIFLGAANGVQVVGNTVAGQNVGVVVAGDQNVLLDNRIGTNPAGTAARPNRLGMFVAGSLDGSLSVGDNNVIGASGFGNVISGNTETGLFVGGDIRLGDTGSGLNRSDVSEMASGIGARSAVASATARWRGETPPEVKGRDRRAGDRSPDENTIAFNRIGTSFGGTQELGNGRATTDENAFAGIFIADGRANQLIGNLVSGNGAGLVILPDEEVGGNPRQTRIGGSIIGGRVGSPASIPNQYGGVLIVESENNEMLALPLEEGGDPVGNVVVGNGVGGVTIRPMSGEGGNKIRGTSFLRNRGPSIYLRDGSLDYPSAAPPIPEILVASLSEDGVTVRFSASTTGEVDVFADGSCPGGNAQGTLIGGGEVGPGTTELPVSNLSAGTALNRYLSLTVTETSAAGMTSEFSDCVRVAREVDIEVVEIASGETGLVIDGVELELEITGNNTPLAKSASTGGVLYAAVYREQIVPQPGPFAGSAVTASGATVTPNAVSSNRHWALRADGLENVTYSVCLNVDGVGGTPLPNQLLVLHRANAGEPWTPYDSSLDGTQLCATGLTAWGELGIGADSQVNPVPDEPLPSSVPTALAVEVYPNPALGLSTVGLAIPESRSVRVVLTDLLGRDVANIQDGRLLAGLHDLELDVSSLAPGVYVIRAEAGREVVYRSLTVVR